MNWTFEEDYLVCKFYMENIADWNYKLDSLMRILREQGFRDRDKASTRMRIQNYVYLHEGNKGLSNVAQQSRDIYFAVRRRVENSLERRELQG